ncbi:hypothetical protein BH09SUM1_BH09SUM1_20560 [soil metagenome]
MEFNKLFRRFALAATCAAAVVPSMAGAQSALATTDSDPALLQLSSHHSSTNYQYGPQFPFSVVTAPGPGGSIQYYWDGAALSFARDPGTGYEAAQTAIDFAPSLGFDGAALVFGGRNLSGQFALRSLAGDASEVTEYAPFAPYDMINVGGKLYFTAQPSTTSPRRSLFTIDSGTGTVTDLMTAFDGSISSLTAAGNTLYFIRKANVAGFYNSQLWKSDGTPATTVNVTNIANAADGVIGGKAMSFNSSASMFQPSRQPYRNMTVQFWIKPESIASSQLFTMGGPNGVTYLNISLNNGAISVAHSGAYQRDFLFSTTTTNYQANVTSSTPVPAGQWTHIAVTISQTDATLFQDGTDTVNLYVNGVSQGSNQASFGYSGAIGLDILPAPQNSQELLGSASYSGLMDEFRIYNSAQPSIAMYQSIKNGLPAASESVSFEEARFDDITKPYIPFETYRGSVLTASNSSFSLPKSVSDMVYDSQNNRLLLPGFSSGHVCLNEYDITNNSLSTILNSLGGSYDLFPEQMVPFGSGRGIAFIGASSNGLPLLYLSPGDNSASGLMQTIPGGVIRNLTSIDPNTIVYSFGAYGTTVDQQLWRFKIDTGALDSWDVFAGGGDDDVRNITLHDDGRVYFTARASASGYALYVLDGDSVLFVSAIPSTAPTATPTHIVSNGGQLFVRSAGSNVSPSDDVVSFLGGNNPFLRLDHAGDTIAGAQAPLSTTPGGFGSQVTGVGDVNGDGFEDFAVAAPDATGTAGANAGRVYLILGPYVQGEHFDDRNYVVFEGVAAGDHAGASLSGAGDFNGDGFSDFVVGAPDATRSGRAEQGEAYIVLGSGARLTPGSVFNLGDTASGKGVLIKGFSTAANRLGSSVSGAGNINGDRNVSNNNGLDDIIIGSEGSSSNRGEAFIIYGARSAPATISLSSLSSAGTRLRILTGDDDNYGSSATGVGDVDGDGYADLVVAGDGSRDNVIPVGPYLLYGKAGLGSSLDLSAPGSSNRVVRLPSDGSDNQRDSLTASQFVAGAGDVNGDGYADILYRLNSTSILPGSSQQRAGLVGLIYGSFATLGLNGAMIDFDSDANSDGSQDGALFEIGTENFPSFTLEFATSLAAAGDVDGDGFSDFLIGSVHYEGLKADNRTYLVHGREEQFPTFSDVLPQGTLGALEIRSFPQVITPGFGSGASSFSSSASAIGDINLDGIGDIAVTGVDSTNQDGKVSILAGGATSTSGTYTNFIPSGLDSTGVANTRLPLYGIGASTDGRFSHPASRLAIAFEGGSGPSDVHSPSRQIVSLSRVAAPKPTGLNWVMAPVQWKVQTDRETQSAAPVASTMKFFFTDADLNGLTLDHVGVYKTTDDPPTVDSSWIPIASIRDDVRRTFTMTRVHTAGNLTSDISGTYSIIDVNDVYKLGEEIIAPSIVRSQIDTPTQIGGQNLYITPDISPSDAAFWHTGTRKLYATSPNSPVQITWRRVPGGDIITTQIVNTRWPDESELQLHVSGSPDVDFGDNGTYQTARLMATDVDNPAGVDKNALENQHLFRANGQTGQRDGGGRSFVMLSSGINPADSPIYFIPVRTVAWNNTAYGISNRAHFVGDEVINEKNNNVILHDNLAGGPFIFQPNCYYNAQPGFYDRTARTGPIFAVNTDQDTTTDNDDFAVVYYQRVSKLQKALDPSVITNAKIFFPYITVRYNMQWNPAANTIIIASLAGSGPLDSLGNNISVYVQNDRTKPGFNPNEEHAVVLSNTIYPLRDDLNVFGSANANNPNTSRPYSLAQFFSDSGYGGMRAFKVVAETSTVKFAYTGTAGKLIQRPIPLSILAPGNDPCPNTSETATPNGSRRVSGSGYIDKNGNLFALAGSDNADFTKSNTETWESDAVNNPPVPVTYQYFYTVQPGFYFPGQTPTEPAVGTCVPWLDKHAGTPGIPQTITYNIVWPKNAPELRAGQTLTEAINGLPDMSHNISVKVIYDQGLAKAGIPPVANSDGTPPGGAMALFSDPLSEKRVPLAALASGIKTEQQGFKLKFIDMTPVLKARIFYDTNAKQLVFNGFYVTEETPEKYVLPNVITPRELAILNALPGSDAAWRTAVALLPTPGAANSSFVSMIGSPSAQVKALSSTGVSQGFMVIAIDDDIGPLPAEKTPPALPVHLEVIKVTCPAYRGAIQVINPDCVFDAKLSFRHTADLSGLTGQYEYQWAYRPDAGNQPVPPRDFGGADVDPNPATNGWIPIPSVYLGGSPTGAVDMTIQGQGILTLSDNWITVRYRKIASPLCGPDWSKWTDAQLGEGWIKRVMGSVDPFRQRAVGGGLQTAEDRFFQYNNMTINTVVSMIAQAGRRFSGNVALNCQTINDFGLIEIYATVLNRGKDLSINGIPPVDYAPANNALLLAASRICDLYMLLGNEAYADAEDPTIGIGSSDEQFGAVSSSIHCFMNQTATLIEEELDLLRGRDDRLSPGVHVAPVFNKLYWNFTRDITGGEVAYALNYNIKDSLGNVDGQITATDAQKQYPQGHGDAWGHYLSAINTYYQLLNDPHYTWTPRAEAVLVNGIPVSVDYLDERKFATAAAAKARTGAEIVNLTYRAAFTENPDGEFTGYKDSDANRAWGVGQWASRAGQAAYFDYVTANAILPATDNTGQGIQKIDRTTVPELGEIVSQLNSIQAKLDDADNGINPIGVAKNVVQFDDLDPTQVVSTFGTAQPHFEGAYIKAIYALNNAKAAFDYANGATQALRNQADTLDEFQQNVREQEADFNAQLIGIFGTPYPGDVGVGGTYPGGYSGPDYIHWMYNDPLSVSGLPDPGAQPITIQSNDFVINADGTLQFDTDGNTPKKTVRSTTYNFALDGSGLVRPTAWTAKRLVPGEVQLAAQDLKQAQLALKQGVSEYSALLQDIVAAGDRLGRHQDLNDSKISILRGLAGGKAIFNATITALKAVELGLRSGAELAEDLSNGFKEAIPTSTIAGLAVGGDFLSGIRGALGIGKASMLGAFHSGANLAEVGQQLAALGKEGLEDGVDIKIQGLEQESEIKDEINELESLARQEPAKRLELLQLALAVDQASAKGRTVLQQGEVLIEQRIRFRQSTSAAVQGYRYKDMAYRIFRSDALNKYRSTFDLASRYAYLCATTYDYETNLLPGDPAVPGATYMTQITRAQSVGTIIDGEPQPGGASGDPGLAAALGRMKSNWDLNLKGRLGFNNPQLAVNVFSLRSEKYRIPDGPEGDEQWRELLETWKVDDIQADEDYQRFSVKLPQTGQPKEPGFVIKFGTEINFAKNYFGNDLEADSTFNPTTTATKMRHAAVAFTDYDDHTSLSKTPFTYYFPGGMDVLRSPTGGNGNIRTWKILEQLLPIPFPLSEGDALSNTTYIPRIDTLTGDFASRRRFALEQVFTVNDFDPPDPANPSPVVYTTRLTGRSVWNTKWVIIIPAGLLKADRADGMQQFIYGDPAKADTGVTDIKLSLGTYAFSGTTKSLAKPPKPYDAEDPPSALDFAPVLGPVAQSSKEVK